MKIYTLGFTKKPAEKFFGLLRAAGATTLVDVRLNNVSQLAQSMLDDYRKHGTGWATYENRFLDLMRHRAIEHSVPRELLDNAVLLCSEDKPHHCHRRLVAEYLARHWDSVTIEHLV